MAQKQEVAKTPVGTPVALPDYLKGYVGPKGTEDWTSSDYAMPRVALLQALSPELQKFDDLKAGNFWHTVVERDLGPSLIIVPIHFSKRYVLWRPRAPIDTGGILARADDGVHWTPAGATFKVKIDKRGTEVEWTTADTVAESHLADWGTYDKSDPNSGPAATECHVVVVGLPDFPELSPSALMLQRKALRPARGLRGKLAFSSAPIYASRFKMTSGIEKAAAGDFWNYSFTPDGFVASEEEFLTYKAMNDTFSKIIVNVRDVEGTEHADEAATGAGDPSLAEQARAEKNF